jgi:flavodoxin
MKVLIVYDSAYGNTEKIAETISGAIAGDVKVLRVGEVSPPDLESLDMLIVGSPTYGGRPTQPIQDFLKGATESAVKGIKVAAFDTRLSAKWAKIFTFAAGKIAGRLKRMGGVLALPPEGFFVQGAKGPLKEGELERATSWAREIIKSGEWLNGES